MSFQPGRKLSFCLRVLAFGILVYLALQVLVMVSIRVPSEVFAVHCGFGIAADLGLELNEGKLFSTKSGDACAYSLEKSPVNYTEWTYADIRQPEEAPEYLLRVDENCLARLNVPQAWQTLVLRKNTLWACQLSGRI